MPTTLTDRELIEEIRSGNTAAFRTFYYRHVDPVFGVVTRILGPARSDREDVVQEVFFQVHRSISRYRGDSSVSTWLYRIAANVAYSALRKPLPPVPVDAEPSAGAVHAEGHVDARRKILRMYTLIDTLSHKNRMVFTLHEFEGLTLDRIAEVLDIPLHTAAARLRRSREHLMTELMNDSVPASEGES